MQLLLGNGDQPQTAGTMASPKWSHGGCSDMPHKTLGRNWSHCLPNFAVCLRNIAFKVRFILSTILSHCGWYAVVFSLVVPSNSQTSLMMQM